VNHVVIMIQENRSFDHYFGQMTAYRQANSYPINGSPATIDDESTGSFSNFSPVTGANIASYHSGFVCMEDLTPDWTETHKNFDWANPAGADANSPMDGFVSLAVQISQYAATLGIQMADQDGHRVMGYFDGNDLNYYYFMASNFAMGPGPGGLTGKTIWQELDAAGVSWKIYSEEMNLFTYLQDFAYFNQPGVSAKVVSITVLQRRWGWPTAGSFVHRDRAARRSFRAHQQL
jgi:phospholipase C